MCVRSRLIDSCASGRAIPRAQAHDPDERDRTAACAGAQAAATYVLTVTPRALIFSTSRRSLIGANMLPNVTSAPAGRAARASVCPRRPIEGPSRRRRRTRWTISCAPARKPRSRHPTQPLWREAMKRRGHRGTLPHPRPREAPTVAGCVVAPLLQHVIGAAHRHHRSAACACGSSRL